MAPGVSRQKNNYFYRADGVGSLSAHYRPPLVEVKAYYHMLLQGERRKYKVTFGRLEKLLYLCCLL